jgi:adenine-specific DNA-methyltransferase
MTDESERVDLETPDLAARNREFLSVLFPGVLSDGVLDAAALADLLEVPVAATPSNHERYGLQWAGKQEALRSLLAPSHGALLPVSESSIDFDSARDVFIEGDNLEVLKLLQRAYNDRVKLIYIDPPYNTGNDFVYNDDFSDGLRGYLAYSGQLDDAGVRTTATTESQGRRHSRWLSMMYPRLVLARNLLTPDGVMAVSIDENEVHQLKLLLDLVFGAENHLNTMVWVSNLKGRQISDGGAVGTHEYILLYARNISLVGQFRGALSELSALMPSVYKGAGYKVKNDDKGPYVTKNELYNTNSKFNELTARTMVFRIHYNPESREVRVTDIDDETIFPGFVTTMPHANARMGVRWHAWRWSRAKILSDHSDLEFDTSGGSLRIWTKIRDVDGVALKDLIIGPSTLTGQADLADLGLERVFDTPKPVSLLRLLVAAVTTDHDVVLDFFAGSGSAAHAVAVQNAVDGGRRRAISVNLPEETADGSEARKAGFETVSDITLARLTRVAMQAGESNFGLRVFRLGPSNFRVPSGDLDLELFESTLATKDLDPQAIAAEVLLKDGVPLDAPWERLAVGGATIVIADGVAVVLSEELNNEMVAAVLALAPRVAVFLEDGFAVADAVKANAVTNARNAGITLKTV